MSSIPLKECCLHIRAFYREWWKRNNPGAPPPEHVELFCSECKKGVHYANKKWSNT